MSIRLIIGKRFETLQQLYTYDVEDYLHLYEFVLIEHINELIAQKKQMENMKNK